LLAAGYRVPFETFASARIYDTIVTELGQVAEQ
jgi:hypothetical protein